MEVFDEHTDLHLISVGPNRLLVLKAVRRLTGLGLKEAKALIESLPVIVKKGMTSPDANNAKRDLEAAGAAASIRWAS